MSMHFKQTLMIGICLVSSNLVFAAVKEYHLTIDENVVNITGKPVKRITVNGQFPAPALTFEEGDEAIIHVQNNLKKQDSSIHWHGLLLPAIMDGVPGLSGFKGIKPNQNYTYKFKIRQSGTYWYHAHSKGQEQDGLYGSLVIYPKHKKALTSYEQTQRDYVVMFSDFHHSTSDQIFKNLKKDAEYYQNQRETIFDVFKQFKKQGLKSTWNDRSMWNQMRMLKTDLSDVTGYTFLVNGKTPEQDWTANFKVGEKIRLRFINASAMSFFDVRIPDLKMTVVSADGQPVQPVAVDEFRIGTAETYDVIVEPVKTNYQIQAESMDRSGFALARLHQENTEKVLFPEPTSRPRALLTMQDMGMEHAEHKQKTQDNHDMRDMQKDSSAHHHANHLQGHMEMLEENQTAHTNTSKHETMLMGHPDHTSNGEMSTQPDLVQGWANRATPIGNKALEYSDLKSLTPQTDTRKPSGEMVIHLGGTMERYIWTMNGKKFNEAEPLHVKYGDRIRIKFVNDSMMAHPMHLHGMFMQLENGQSSEYMPNKHTIIVPPGKTVTALLTADEPGEWAIHCHLLYHMSAGMMNKLVVANVADENTSTKASSERNNAQNMKGEQHAHH
nr:copper resistance system multicopper oxidase [Acinetobacter sp. Marseille-Q1620]